DRTTSAITEQPPQCRRFSNEGKCADAVIEDEKLHKKGGAPETGAVNKRGPRRKSAMRYSHQRKPQADNRGERNGTQADIDSEAKPLEQVDDGMLEKGAVHVNALSCHDHIDVRPRQTPPGCQRRQ